MKIIKRMGIIVFTIVLILICLSCNTRASESEKTARPEIDLENCTVIDIVINSNEKSSVNLDTKENFNVISNNSSKENFNLKSSKNLVQETNENQNVNPNKLDNITMHEELQTIAQKSEQEEYEIQQTNTQKIKYNGNSTNYIFHIIMFILVIIIMIIILFYGNKNNLNDNAMTINNSNTIA